MAPDGHVAHDPASHLSELRDKVRQQLDLEDEARALGSERYRASRPLPWRTDAASEKEEAELPPGRQLLKLAIEPTAAALSEWVERIQGGGAGRRPLAIKLLSLAEPHEIAYLTARMVVNGAAKLDSLQATALDVSAAIVDHVEMQRLRGANRGGYSGLQKTQRWLGYSRKKRAAIHSLMKDEGVALTFDRNTLLSAGLKAIELLCDATGLFTKELASRGGTRESYILRPTEAAGIWLDRQHARCEILEPIHLPMVVRPRRWRTPFWGGYLSKRPGLRLVKQRTPAYQAELRFVDMPDVYDAVNAVQETPWRINRRVLEAMRAVWDGGGSLGGLPAREDDPIPPRPADFELNPDAATRWKAEAATAHARNAKTLSRRLAVSQRLWIAQKFAEEPAIWFPHELDFRGRIYPIPTSGPHPQGEDSAKALIEFAEGKPLGDLGGWWLAVHIANLFGVDKVSFDDRLAWVREHGAELVDSGENPLDGGRFWATADSPWLALAACIEWAGYVREGPGYVSHQPVALDGSNSGLQHFSAMLRDPVGARAVNLLPVDRPQDVYSQVAAIAQATADATPTIAVTVRGEDGEEREEIIPNPWRGGKVTRKIAKRPCMTYCYSATRFGMQDMILQTLRELDKDGPPHLGGVDNYKAANWLSYVLWEAIAETVAAASRAMEWLREAAKIASQAGRPIWWTTPAGLPVIQDYRQVSAERVSVHWGGRELKLSLNVDTSKIDRRAQANAIAPNFVHSCDAAHLMAVVNALAGRGLGSIAVIHDSFATHAADAQTLSHVLRETFVDQYTPDVLARFRDELVAQLPADLAEQVPPLPALGDLDLQALLAAEYMFA